MPAARIIVREYGVVRSSALLFYTSSPKLHCGHCLHERCSHGSLVSLRSPCCAAAARCPVTPFHSSSPIWKTIAAGPRRLPNCEYVLHIGLELAVSDAARSHRF
jgi:hypothetical protein